MYRFKRRIFFSLLLISQYSYAQHDTSFIEFKKVIMYDNGTYFEETYGTSIPDSVPIAHIDKFIEAINDSIFLATYFQNKKNNFRQEPEEFKKTIGIQILAKTRRPVKNKFPIEIKINSKVVDTTLVDFAIKDSVFKDYSPVIYLPVRLVRRLDLEFIKNSELDVPVVCNYITNNFRLQAVFPQNGLKDIMRNIQILSRPYFLRFNDTFNIHDWRPGYEKTDIDTIEILKSIQFDSIANTEKIRKQYIVLPKFLKVKLHQHLFFWFSPIYPEDKLEYRLVPWLEYDNDHIPWKNGVVGNSILEIAFKQAGAFQLQVRNSNNPRDVVTQTVNVIPEWYQTLAFKIGFLGAGIVLAICSFVLYHRRKQKRKIKALELKSRETLLNLSFIRAQLNPHFIFNALNSVQGLILKRETNKANDYLVAFSKMLRKPLDPKETRYWTLADEIDLLHNYIKIEQLRMPFEYKVNVALGILPELISFPALLLQPIVENSIRHGISNRPAKSLVLTIERRGFDLRLEVTDDGPGFDPGAQYNGNGLRLTREYIALLNQQYPGNRISVSVYSEESGTRTIFIFENWLDE